LREEGEPTYEFQNYRGNVKTYQRREKEIAGEEFERGGHPRVYRNKKVLGISDGAHDTFGGDGKREGKKEKPGPYPEFSAIPSIEVPMFAGVSFMSNAKRCPGPRRIARIR
jgi:hypothetical protein